MTPLMVANPAAAAGSTWRPATPARAQSFYEALFGWTVRTEQANGGVFTGLQVGNEEIGSIYQLQRVHRESGVPSHWTPYVGSTTSSRRQTGRDPRRRGAGPAFAHRRRARIAVIVDPVGAPLGLWQPLAKPAETTMATGRRKPVEIAAASRGRAGRHRRAAGGRPCARRRSGRSRSSIRPACCGTGCTARPQQPRFRVRLASVDGKKREQPRPRFGLVPHCSINDVRQTDIIVVSASGWDLQDRIVRNTLAAALAAQLARQGRLHRRHLHRRRLPGRSGPARRPSGHHPLGDGRRAPRSATPRCAGRPNSS